MDIQRSLPSIDETRIVSALGGLYVAFAVGWGLLQVEPFGDSLVVVALTAVPGFVLLYGGYRLPRSDISPEFYPTVVRWCLGGLGGMIVLLGIYELQPASGLSHPVQNGFILTAVGGVAGFGVGLHDARARTRALRVEDQNQELQRYQMLVQEVEEYAIFRLDTEGRVQSWNAGAEKIKGYRADEILGEHFSRFYTEEDRAAGVPERNLEAAVAEGYIDDEGWRVRADGTRFWANVTITALHDEDGDVRGFAKVTRDMTERREYERELREEKERFESLVQEVEEYAIFRLDTEGRVRSWNAGAEKIKGYRADEILGEHFSRFYTEEDRAAGVPEKNLEAAIIHGSIDDEGWRARADGTRFWANVTITALHDDDGGLEGFAKVTRDMTEHREYERELREEKERFESLVQEVEEYAIFVLDTEGRVQSWNAGAKRIKGYETEEILGEHFSRFYTEEDRAAGVPEQNLAKAVDHDSIDDEGWRVRADGTQFWANVTITALHDDGGDVRGFAKVTRDMTERKRLEDDLRQERDLRERIFETSPVGIAVVDRDGTVTFLNDRAEQLIGRTREELDELPHASPLLDIIDEEGTTVPDEEMPFPRILATGDPIFDADFRLARPDGEHLWISVNGAPLVGESEAVERVVLSFEDVTERKRYRDRLVSLNELSQDLDDAETEGAVDDLAVEAAREILPLPLVAIASYDEESGRLHYTARSPAVAELADDDPLLELEHELPWQAFANQTETTCGDLLERDDVSGSETTLRSVIAFPLGKHGVFLGGATVANAFSDTDVSLAKMLVANVRSALDRVERERTLRERKNALEEQAEALGRVERVNGIIRGITQELIQSSTREEIVQAVCDRLATAEAYRFAWIGAHDAVTDEITPEAWTGDDDGYLEAVTVTTGGDGGEPTGEAVRTEETQVRNSLAADPPFEPWEQAAIDRGYRASIAVPLPYQETVYGVLTLYTDEADAFDRMEEAVLTELGETIGYALNALERKQALVSEQSVELEFQLRNGDPPLFQFAGEHDCEVEFENIVQRADGTPGIFFTIRGVGADEVLAFGERSPEIDDVTLVSDRGDEALFEVRLRDSAFFSALLDRGAMPQTLTATGGEGRAVIRVPRSSNVRSFVDLFQAQYEEAELVARREMDEPIKTQHEFEAEFRSQLTERQEEILRTAYASGFFDWPREMSAQDLAEMLGVSQPTVSRHVRAGERKLFGLVFDEE